MLEKDKCDVVSESTQKVNFYNLLMEYLELISNSVYSSRSEVIELEKRLVVFHNDFSNLSVEIKLIKYWLVLISIILTGILLFNVGMFIF